MCSNIQQQQQIIVNAQNIYTNRRTEGGKIKTFLRDVSTLERFDNCG